MVYITQAPFLLFQTVLPGITGVLQPVSCSCELDPVTFSVRLRMTWIACCKTKQKILPTPFTRNTCLPWVSIACTRWSRDPGVPRSGAKRGHYAPMGGTRMPPGNLNTIIYDFLIPTVRLSACFKVGLSSRPKVG